MSGELEADFLTGKTAYFQVRSSTGTIWNGSAFEAYQTAHVASYAIAATEQGSASGYYTASMPAVPSGTYNVTLKQQAGASVAESDTTVGVGTVPWDGSAVVVPANVVEWLGGTPNALVNGKVDAANVLRSGTAQGSGGASSITLDAGASSTNSYYVDSIIYIVAGTGAGQSGRQVITYTGSSKIATVFPNWITQPDNTSQFILLVFGQVDVGCWNNQRVPGPSVSGVPVVDVQYTRGTASAGAPGYVGPDWSAVNAPTSTVGLTNTTISISQAVASVSGSVTVGTNSDKTGYALSSSGVDAITVETGLNLRQAVAITVAAEAGKVSGAGTGTISITGAGVNTTRIVATVDASGDRTALTLTPPP